MTQQEILDKLKLDIRLRGLSEGTLKAYHDAARLFMRYYGKPADQMGEAEFRDYLRYLLDERKITTTTINMYNSALRFLFEVTLEHNINYKRTARFKCEHIQPRILNREEIGRLFSVIKDIKHRAIFLNIYGSGLRASEIGRLRVQDVDSTTMRLFIHQAKGKKDRYTLLSQFGLEALRVYWRVFRPASGQGFLFPAKGKSGHLSVEGVEEAFRKYYALSGITSPATVHSLRHSFATHLLENGAEPVYIKHLLGHATFNATNRYLHFANTDVYKTRSPLDALAASNGSARP